MSVMIADIKGVGSRLTEEALSDPAGHSVDWPPLSGIPQAVMATAEAVIASGVDAKVVQAGNPTSLEGEAAGVLRRSHVY